MPGASNSRSHPPTAKKVRMSLPDLIEIIPPTEVPEALSVTIPGSKSITNRALILAALAEGTTTLRGALWSEDTQAMTENLRRLGFAVEVEPDPNESCNRTLKVTGKGGVIPNAGTPDAPLDLFVENAGTAARFLTALVCLGQGTYRLDGIARMRERPQAALFDSLRQLGYVLESPNDKLPVIVHGKGPIPGKCGVSIEESSQFASALILCQAQGMWEVEVTGDSEENAPYIGMTRSLIMAFPRQGGVFDIEADSSSGSYFCAAPLLMGMPVVNGQPAGVASWPTTDWQIDSRFPAFVELPARVSRQTDLGDSIMTAIVLAPFAGEPVCFSELERLRVQECERVVAMRTELAKCGAEVLEEGETLTISPAQAPLHGTEIETYNDHRVAMCFAILGLKVPGIKIKNPACVKKTFPNFFQKLSAPQPNGLGVTIIDASGRPLGVEELFAA